MYNRHVFGGKSMSCPCGNGDWYHGCLSGIRNRNGAGAVGGHWDCHGKLENSIDLNRFISDLYFYAAVPGSTSYEWTDGAFVGLKLFGIAGLFLGPLGLLLIEDMTELLITQPMNDEQRHNETNKSAMIDGGNRFMSHWQKSRSGVKSKGNDVNQRESMKFHENGVEGDH